MVASSNPSLTPNSVVNWEWAVQKTVRSSDSPEFQSRKDI